MRFEKGYIKFYRRAAFEDIGKNPICLALWTWLLCSATRFESKIIWRGKQRVIPKGTVLFSMTTLAEEWRCARTTISRWLHYLNDTGRLSTERGPKGVIVSICNWNEYQENQNSPVTNANREVSAGAPLGVREVSYNREVKNLRSKENYYGSFEGIYQLYPKQMGRSQGIPKCREQIKTVEELQALTKAVKNYSKHIEIAKTDPKYVKSFSSFMDEWRDWIDPDPSMLRAAGGGAGIDWDYIFDRKGKT